jgi:hypothetical protein
MKKKLLVFTSLSEILEAKNLTSITCKLTNNAHMPIFIKSASITKMHSIVKHETFVVLFLFHMN